MNTQGYIVDIILEVTTLYYQFSIFHIGINKFRFKEYCLLVLLYKVLDILIILLLVDLFNYLSLYTFFFYFRFICKSQEDVCDVLMTYRVRHGVLFNFTS